MLVNHAYSRLLHTLAPNLFPPIVSLSPMLPRDLIRALQLLQIRGHSRRGMLDAITQSASFEKERSMDPLSPSPSNER